MGEAMKTSVEAISPVKKKLTIEIEAIEVDKKVDAAYSALGKRAKVPGFRPGKIPRNIMERHFGQQVVDSVTKDLVNETLPKAVEETETFPLTMPVVENEIIKKGQTFKYSAIMEVKPEFDLKNYMGLQVEKEIFSVSDEKVEKQLEEIRWANGQLKPLEEDRGAQKDDYAVLAYEGFEGDQPIEGVKSENFLLKIGSNDFHPDFEKALIGRKKDDEIDITVRFEDDHQNVKLAGKEVAFKVKVQEIKVMELPELNDDFAKTLGADFEDLAALREKLQEEMTKREEKRIDAEVKKRLIKQIAEGVDFELPESLVESEIRFGIENLKQNLVRAGADMEKAGFHEERLKTEFRPAAESRVKDMLILGEVAKQNDLSVGESELAESFREMSERTGQEVQVLRQYYEANRLIDTYRQSLLEEKTLNYLVNGATINELEADKIAQEKE